MSTSQQEGNSNVFKTQFGGELINIIESIEPDFPYTRERKEPFFLVSIPIKDKMNINEALDEFCSEEYFKDENKLHVEKYDAKVAVSKKILFKQLPPTIIFNLKRFEYDMKTYQRYKLNDFFEFP
jgi:ubiquitin carboxyl-terminal hydrolase 34